MDILRFITAGSVDDGKSTLIGRLLYDSKNILTDQLESIGRQSKNKEQGEIDLALLTDGLRAEREQGITIDVAYKYFTTPQRKFIIADAPGHIQYTRNMVTGASNTDLIIVLIDARHGVVEQTRRHSIIASLLQLPQVVVAVNKMDLVDYAEETYARILHDYAQVATSLELKNVTYIPVSALDGDNIVEPSVNMPWYDGPSLLELLETVPVREETNHEDPRFPVQYVIRPQTDELHDYRGYAGRVTGGIYQPGDAVTIWPSGKTSTIRTVQVGGEQVAAAFAQQSATLQLADNIDISRGDVIVHTGHTPRVSQNVEALVVWLHEQPLIPGNRYLLQVNNRIVPAIVQELEYRLDVNTLDRSALPAQAALNEVVKAKIKTAAPVVFDPYRESRSGGGAILVDETSFVTVGAALLQ